MSGRPTWVWYESLINLGEFRTKSAFPTIFSLRSWLDRDGYFDYVLIAQDDPMAVPDLLVIWGDGSVTVAREYVLADRPR